MWTGDCNRCGLCCRCFLGCSAVIHAQHVRPPIAVAVLEFRCRNLVVIEPLGQPGATLCRIHEKIYPGMPIDLESAHGNCGKSTCAADYPRSYDAVPPECSYIWSGDPEKKPVWTPGYLPDAKI